MLAIPDATSSIDELLASANAYIDQSSLAERTVKSYDNCNRIFDRWLSEHVLPLQPPHAIEVIVAFLTSMAVRNLSPSRVDMYLFAILDRQRRLGCPFSDGEKEVLHTLTTGIRRSWNQPRRQRTALTPSDLLTIYQHRPAPTADVAGGRAAFLLFYRAGLDLSTICGLQREEVHRALSDGVLRVHDNKQWIIPQHEHRLLCVPTALRDLLEVWPQQDHQTLSTAVPTWILRPTGHLNRRPPLLRSLRFGLKRARAEQNVDDVTLERASAWLDQHELRYTRDMAFIFLGYAGAFRAIDLTMLQVNQLTRVPQGFVVHLPRSKGDRLSQGVDVSISRSEPGRLCPVAALESWLRIADITEGPVFRLVRRRGTWPLDTPMNIQEAYKVLPRRTTLAGLAGDWGSHSMKVGSLTAAREAGASFPEVVQLGRHTHPEVTLGYVRQATPVHLSTSLNL